jgi:hypothetical protein
VVITDFVITTLLFSFRTGVRRFRRLLRCSSRERRGACRGREEYRPEPGLQDILMQLTGIALIIEGLALLIVMALKSKAA